MSDSALEIAMPLLEKTEGGKVRWFEASDSDREAYRSDIESEKDYIFWISRQTSGDDKSFVFEVKRSEKTVLLAKADNTRLPWSKTVPPGFSADGVERFRLFSDLFLAAKKVAVAENPEIDELQHFIKAL